MQTNIIMFRPKSKMRYSATILCNLSVNKRNTNKYYETGRETFTYLGFEIEAKGGFSAEIRGRICYDEAKEHHIQH